MINFISSEDFQHPEKQKAHEVRTHGLLTTAASTAIISIKAQVF